MVLECPGAQWPLRMLPYLSLPLGSWYHDSGIEGCIVIVTPGGGNYEPDPLPV